MSVEHQDAGLLQILKRFPAKFRTLIHVSDTLRLTAEHAEFAAWAIDSWPARPAMSAAKAFFFVLSTRRYNCNAV
jgi:hypothetical protein